MPAWKHVTRQRTSTHRNKLHVTLGVQPNRTSARSESIAGHRTACIVVQQRSIGPRSDGPTASSRVLSRCRGGSSTCDERWTGTATASTPDPMGRQMTRAQGLDRCGLAVIVAVAAVACAQPAAAQEAAPLPGWFETARLGDDTTRRLVLPDLPELFPATFWAGRREFSS